jgi:peptidoglycan/LPS O-acetylase OafA/YrhL
MLPSARTLSDLRNSTFTSFLDFTRWVCAWTVFLGRLRNPLFVGFESFPACDRRLTIYLWYFVTGWFGEAVIVFFVLCGYLVGAVACAKAQIGRFNVIDYAIDRFSRICLPLVPALS